MQTLIALGSNLEDPIKQVTRGFEALEALSDLVLVARSSLYTSAPQGPQDQADFCNAIALCETNLPPSELLYALQAIEQSFGRIKTRHWGERIIDLDIAFYGQLRVQTENPNLQIPHRYALQRDFVVIPALEVAPDWCLPDGRKLHDTVADMHSHALRKLEQV